MSFHCAEGLMRRLSSQFTLRLSSVNHRWRLEDIRGRRVKALIHREARTLVSVSSSRPESELRCTFVRKQIKSGTRSFLHRRGNVFFPSFTQGLNYKCAIICLLHVGLRAALMCSDRRHRGAGHTHHIQNRPTNIGFSQPSASKEKN